MQKLNVLVYDSISEKLLELLNTTFEVNLVKYNKGGVSRGSVDLIIFNEEEKGDLHPDYYSEVVGSKTNVMETYWSRYGTLRDFDFRDEIPKLGIGDGAHFLTTSAGGSLIQHVEGHDKDHPISTRRHGGFVAPSKHHQMMYPFELPKDKFDLLAWSKYFVSETYLNGKNDEVNLPTDFLEPEIVFYRNIKAGALCIQGTPILASNSYKNLCLSLISKLVNKTL